MSADLFALTTRDDARSIFADARLDRAVLALDLDGRIIDVNRPFLDFVGYSRRALIGQPISLLQEMDSGLARAQALPRLQRGMAVPAELVLCSISGKRRHLNARLLPLIRQGGLCGVVIIGRVTETPQQDATEQDGTQKDATQKDGPPAALDRAA